MDNHIIWAWTISRYKRIYLHIYIYMSLDLSQSSHANYWDCSVQHEPSGETLLMFAYRVDLSVLAPCVVCGWLEADDACFEVRSWESPNSCTRHGAIHCLYAIVSAAFGDWLFAVAFGGGSVWGFVDFRQLRDILLWCGWIVSRYIYIYI